MKQFLPVLMIAFAACSGSKSPVGACVVEYDDLGSKGLACTVVSDADCKDDVRPAVVDLATAKRHSFTPEKTCADTGYKQTCPKSPIAWTFKNECPL